MQGVRFAHKQSSRKKDYWTLACLSPYFYLFFVIFDDSISRKILYLIGYVLAVSPVKRTKALCNMRVEYQKVS